MDASRKKWDFLIPGAEKNEYEQYSISQINSDIIKQVVLCFIRARHHELSRDINMYKLLRIYQLILPYPFCVSNYCFLYRVATLAMNELSIVSPQEAGTSHVPFCLPVLYFYFNPLKIISYFL